MLDINRHAVTVTPPAHQLRGKVVLPGSKSITNRALLLAALAQGTSHLTGALKSDDTKYMAQALMRMGVSVTQDDATSFTIIGNGHLQPVGGPPIFLGNAGTAMRFLAAAVANVTGDVTLDGDAHMRKRPIGALTQALRALGVDARDDGGFPPVTVHGTGGFVNRDVAVDGSLSSQYVSAILMAAPAGKDALDISVAGGKIGARGYIDISIAVMRAFGAHVTQRGEAAWHVAAEGYRACQYAIEPDSSAATYLWAAEKLTGGEIDLGMAAGQMSQPDALAYGPIALFPKMPGAIDGSQMQDAIPTLAVMAAFNEQPVRFTGIANLRVKECDRTAALSEGLNRIRPGLAQEEGDDLIVKGDPSLAGRHMLAEIRTFSDHRIAMAFALAGLQIHGVKILDPACVSKTYPSYWDALASLGVSLAFE